MLQTGVDGGLIWGSARTMERSGLGSVSLLFRCRIHADRTSPGAEAPRVMRTGPLNSVYRAVQDLDYPWQVEMNDPGDGFAVWGKQQ